MDESFLAKRLKSNKMINRATSGSETTLQEGRKEMFYLTTHSTHFIYGYMASDIWLRTIMLVRKETRCRHIGFFYMHHPTDRIAHTTAFVTPVVEHYHIAR